METKLVLTNIRLLKPSQVPKGEELYKQGEELYKLLASVLIP